MTDAQALGELLLGEPGSAAQLPQANSLCSAPRFAECSRSTRASTT
jgi:hypothetical protein